MQNARIVRTWAGIEGSMPDAIPVLGPSCNAPGVIHAFGFSAHGFQLGPIGGQIVAELIDTGASSLPIEPFSIARFQTEAVRVAS
jgi:sarcosine oxidase subunit beta